VYHQKANHRQIGLGLSKRTFGLDQLLSRFGTFVCNPAFSAKIQQARVSAFPRRQENFLILEITCATKPNRAGRVFRQKRNLGDLRVQKTQSRKTAALQQHHCTNFATGYEYFINWPLESSKWHLVYHNVPACPEVDSGLKVGEHYAE
jgi:hypothetical protein